MFKSPQQPTSALADTSPKDRRATVRFTCPVETTCALADANSHVPRWALARDISLNGIGLILMHPFELGSTLVVEVKNPLQRMAITLFVRVVRCIPGGDGSWSLGCVFPRPISEQLLCSLL